MSTFVIKLGTQTLMTDQGYLNMALLGNVSQWAARQCQQGHRVLVVTSGAMGLGKAGLRKAGLGKVISDKTNLKPGPSPLPSDASRLTHKQAAAAIGQPLLMAMYQTLFTACNQKIAQVLVSASDFAQRDRYLSLKNTLDYLMHHGVIPIVNENDVISSAGIEENAQTRAFNDNDQLSAIVAAKLHADVLIILTNVNGVYTANPAQHPEATRIARVDHLSQLDALQVDGQSSMGRGGMRSKLHAARLAAMSGVHTWIAPAYANLNEVLSEADVNLTPDVTTTGDSTKRSVTTGTLSTGTLSTGTWIAALPTAAHLPQRDQWIGYASGFQGIVVINDGARQALLERGATLLAVGVVAVQGSFLAHQVVSVQDTNGNELGRGVSEYSSQQVLQWLDAPERPKNTDVIHRNNLVMFEQYA
jgi:glutamate 5-kinase